MLHRLLAHTLSSVVTLILVTPMSGAVVDFGSSPASLPYTEEGLTFTDVTGTSPVTIGSFSSDMALLGGTNLVPIHVRASGNQPFDLISLDIEGITRTWRIESSSGASISPSAFGTIDFTALTGWTSIDYFDIIHNPGEANGSIQVDNVVFNFVPEPSSAMVLVGLCASMLLRRRQLTTGCS